MKALLCRQFRSNHGFTVAELLVALGLASVVLSIIVTFFMNLTRSSTTQNAIAGAQQSARAGLDYMIHDIRMAGLDPFNTAGAGIEEISAAGNKLRFTCDRCNLGIDTPGCAIPAPDGDVNDDSERVTYVFDAATRVLKRCLYETSGTFGLETSSGSCQSILKNVMPNPDGISVFTFLDDEDNTITSNADRSWIRTVVLTLTVEEPAGTKKTVARTYASRLRLRNIGL
jgi:prepilin-type N-terminal cleavage/methylation domain-containing protein